MKFGGIVLNPFAGKKATKKVGEKAELAAKVALFEVASAVHQRAVDLINDNQDGTKQKRRNVNVFVSRPGDPPNTDTGRLVKSIFLKFENNAKTAKIGTNLKYGAWLEFGTLNMAARPWLSKAFKLETGKAVELFAKIYKKEK